MITAVDSSVLLDLLTDDPDHGTPSLRSLQRARNRGRIVACPIVWAEVRAFLASDEEVEALIQAGVDFDSFDRETADLAGRMWREYRQHGGKRVRVVADFLIAAHARVRADVLLTRDRGFTRRYFQDLKLQTPA